MPGTILKLFNLILLTGFACNISEAQAQNYISRDDWDSIFFHYENGMSVENTDTKKFENWYRTLDQENKNQILADSVAACAPKFTEIALQNGGDINTPVYMVKVAIPLGFKTYVFTSGQREQILKSVGGKEVGFERFNSYSPLIIEGLPSVSYVSLLSQGLLSCDGADAGLFGIKKKNPDDISPKMQMTQILLKHGARADIFNEFGESAPSHILSSMVDGNTAQDKRNAEVRQIFKMLTEKTPSKGWPPEVSTGIVIYAFTIGDKEILDLVRAQKFPVSFKTKAAHEALIHIASLNNPTAHKMLSDLLQNGVDVNYKNAAGQTALFAAVAKQNAQAVKILLEQGADAAITDKYGNNAWKACDMPDNLQDDACALHPLGQQARQKGQDEYRKQVEDAKKAGVDLM
ncbi:MAG: ankyrin repeat domain-containing protein [Alphaproteobacteria bacterium]